MGIYADEASGRHNAKMHNFQKMLQDCREKKINFILVKSISRMGRNTLQFLKTCDEFNRLGVEVFFEVEKLYISNPEAVRILTIYASVYQNESEEKSANISWGIRTRFASGTSAFASRPCYGYTKSAEGLLTPDLETSEVVKLIYELHNAGFSLRKISTELYDMKIPSPRGKPTWGVEAIRRILSNEKYYGNVLLQKTFVSDYFTGKQSVNKGELPQYLIKNNHDAIIK